jgi:hypothetical protein
MWVSWKHENTEFSTPLTFAQKVEVFYEQTLGWQLHIADLIANGGTTFGESKLGTPGYAVISIRHSGFAVLHICVSYFELVGSVVIPRSPKASDTEKFKTGVKRVFPELFNASGDGDRLLKLLHKGARCGLYHAGRTRQKVGLGSPSDGSAIAYIPQSDAVIISPERLPVALKAHLEKFKLELLNPANTALRDQFQRRFDEEFE